jgi:hypothetical protein
VLVHDRLETCAFGGRALFALRNPLLVLRHCLSERERLQRRLR